MKTPLHNRLFGFKVLPAAALAVATSMTAYAPSATAGHGGAWGLGGLLAGSMLTRARDRDRAAVYTAGEMQGASAAAPPAAAPSPTMTIEQKLNELNKLAANDYITPAEYKAKKQALLNSL